MARARFACCTSRRILPERGDPAGAALECPFLGSEFATPHALAQIPARIRVAVGPTARRRRQGGDVISACVTASNVVLASLGDSLALVERVETVRGEVPG